MFKFFDKANSGPHAYFLKRFASISSGFPAQKRLLLYHGSGGRHCLLISEAGSQPCIKGSSPQLTWRQQFLSSAKKRKLLQALRLRKMYATRPSASAWRCKFSHAPPWEGTPRPTGGQHLRSEPWEAFVLCTKHSETGRQPQETTQAHLCSRIMDKFLEEKEK